MVQRICLLWLVVLAASAQEPAFSVASVKVHQFVAGPGGGGRGPGNMMKIVRDPARITFSAVGVDGLIQFAFDNQRVEGLKNMPAWFGRTYDISATSVAPATMAEQKKMLQSLLAERFGMKWHVEKRDSVVYDLVAGPKPNLVAAGESNDPTVTRFVPMLKMEGGRADTLFTNHRASMGDLAGLLTNWLSHPVTDKTGIKGLFDIVVRIKGPDMTDAVGRVEVEMSDSDYIAAVQSQLGLKIETQKHGSVDVLVIDKVQEPSEN